MRTTADHHSSFEFKSSSLKEAKEVRGNPVAQFHSFTKQLLKSHMSGCFLLALPKKFCDMHLPSQDDTIILVDENEQEFRAKYSVRKHRLSGGWRDFSVAHNLLEGDALVFHLIEPCKFRVDIARAIKLTEDDGIDIQTNDFRNSRPTSTVKVEANARSGKTARPLNLNSPAMDSRQGTKKARLNPDCELETGQSGNGSYPFTPSVLEGVRYSNPVEFLEDVNCSEDTKIQVDGLVLNSQISKNLRVKYHKLCCSQNMSLHSHLIKGLSGKLAVAVISETINIADAIRSADFATPQHYLECWDTALKAFEDLGMAVGFLRDRLHKLLSFSHESQATTESKKIKQASIANLEAEIEALDLKNKELDFEFRIAAQVPW